MQVPGFGPSFRDDIKTAASRSINSMLASNMYFAMEPGPWNKKNNFANH